VTDLKTQIDTLKLLIASVESDLAAREHDRLTAESAEAWLLMLRERVSEVEADTDEEFAKRRELVKLPVERIDVDRDENGNTRAAITYRFAPPGEDVVEYRLANSEMFDEVPIPGY
jgi:hypothetical protein